LTTLETKYIEELESFRDKAKDGRLIKYWNNISDLRANVILSLKVMMADPEISAGGWIKASMVSSAPQDAELHKKYLKLIEENNRLRSKFDNEVEENNKKTMVIDRLKTEIEGLNKIIADQKKEISALLSKKIPGLKIGELYPEKLGGIDWLMLAVEDGKALLITEKIIGTQPYHKEGDEITWAECSLRDYLNGKFYDSLGDDRLRIADTWVITNNNPWCGTDGGDPVTDKIFLLSIEEVVQYFGDSGQLKNINPKSEYYIYDKFNVVRIAYGEKDKASWWWLRSPGGASIFAAFVDDDGEVSLSGYFVDCDTVGVRPAMWLNL